MLSIQQKEIDAGLRMAEYPDLSGKTWKTNPNKNRVTWANALRAVVAKRMPRNKCGVPIVSDVDLLFATDGEREEALKKIVK